MSTLTVSNLKGDTVGSVEIPDAILNADHKPQTLQNALVAYRANQRGGNHSTLTKGEVAGHGKKPWRQKGTGRARAGYRQSPLWRGGGVVFGPKPRDYSKKVTAKSGQAALRLAFGQQVKAQIVSVIDAIELKDAKTKALLALLKPLQLTRGGLIVVDVVSRELGLAARNLPDLEVCEARNVNSYQLLRYPRVLVTKAGLDVLQKRLEIATEVA